MASKPWLVPGVPWKSEAAFWSWVRGGLRKLWSKHPVKISFIKLNRKRIKNPKPSVRFPEVWGMQCAKCLQDTVQSEIEIDHIAETGCKFTGLDDIKSYSEHLFLVDFGKLRALCKVCHRIVSHSQNTGLSFEEAALDKKVIEMLKDKKKTLAFLAERKYTGVSVSNEPKRRLLLEQILRREMNV